MGFKTHFSDNLDMWNTLPTVLTSAKMGVIPWGLGIVLSPYLVLGPIQSVVALPVADDSGLQDSSAPLEQVPTTPMLDLDAALGSFHRADAETIAQESSVDSPPSQTTVDAEIDHDVGDPDLGILRLQLHSQPPSNPERFPKLNVFVQGNGSYSSSSNILSSRDPVDDQVFRTGIGVSVIPQLSPRSFLMAELGQDWVQYDRLSNLNFSEFSTQLKLRHLLTPSTFGEVGWSHEQFHDDRSDREFLRNDTLKLALIHRTQVNPDLSLTSFLQTDYAVASPANRSQFVNRLGTHLNYDLLNTLDLGFTYRLDLSLFTQQDRFDLYNQAVGSLSWEFAPYNHLRVFSGFTFGDSSEANLGFNSVIFGVGIQSGIKLY